MVVKNEKVEGKAKDDTQKSLPKTDVKNVETDAEQVEKNDDTKTQPQNENAKENWKWLFQSKYDKMHIKYSRHSKQT